MSKASYMVTSGKTEFSSIRVPDLKIPVVAASKDMPVTWQLEGGESVTGTLVADYSIIDPDPPMNGDEVYVYYTGAANGQGFTNVKRTKRARAQSYPEHPGRL